jgi:hypothetical protein
MIRFCVLKFFNDDAVKEKVIHHYNIIKEIQTEIITVKVSRNTRQENHRHCADNCHSGEDACS